MNKQEQKQVIIDFIGKENIEKARISKDGKGIWLYNKRFKTMPLFFDFNSIDYLHDDDENSRIWRNELLIEFKGEAKRKTNN